MRPRYMLITDLTGEQTMSKETAVVKLLKFTARKLPD